MGEVILDKSIFRFLLQALIGGRNDVFASDSGEEGEFIVNAVDSS